MAPQLAAAAAPFASMFSSDKPLACAQQLRVGALGSDPAAAAAVLLVHAARLVRVSEVLHAQLSPHLAARSPHEPLLLLLDAAPDVLRALHGLLYQADVCLPASLLPGLLRLAVLYEMPELELWVLQEAQAAGQRLAVPPGACAGRGGAEALGQEWCRPRRCRSQGEYSLVNHNAHWRCCMLVLLFPVHHHRSWHGPRGGARLGGCGAPQQAPHYRACSPRA